MQNPNAKVIYFSPNAEFDLETIGNFIARDNPAKALSFIVELRQCCSGIAQTPEAFALVPRYKSMGIRRRVFGAYLIFYRINQNRVEVVHILHGAMNYEQLLFPELG